MQVCTHYQLFVFQVLHQQTPVVIPYSKTRFPKAKGTRIKKEAGPQMGQGKAAEVQRHLCRCLSQGFPAAQREHGLQLRAPDDFRESFDPRQNCTM